MSMTWGLSETPVGLPPHASWPLVEESQRAVLPLSLGGGHQGPTAQRPWTLFSYCSTHSCCSEEGAVRGTALSKGCWAYSNGGTRPSALAQEAEQLPYQTLPRVGRPSPVDSGNQALLGRLLSVRACSPFL